MMSKTGKQTKVILISPITSRSKGNQAIKFGQLIEYNVKNNFLQKMWQAD